MYSIHVCMCAVSTGMGGLGVDLGSLVTCDCSVQSCSLIVLFCTVYCAVHISCGFRILVATGEIAVHHRCRNLDLSQGKTWPGSWWTSRTSLCTGTLNCWALWMEQD